MDLDNEGWYFSTKPYQGLVGPMRPQGLLHAWQKGDLNASMFVCHRRALTQRNEKAFIRICKSKWILQFLFEETDINGKPLFGEPKKKEKKKTKPVTEKKDIPKDTSAGEEHKDEPNEQEHSLHQAQPENSNIETSQSSRQVNTVTASQQDADSPNEISNDDGKTQETQKQVSKSVSNQNEQSGQTEVPDDEHPTQHDHEEKEDTSDIEEEPEDGPLKPVVTTVEGDVTFVHLDAYSWIEKKSSVKIYVNAKELKGIGNAGDCISVKFDEYLFDVQITEMPPKRGNYRLKLELSHAISTSESSFKVKDDSIVIKCVKKHRKKWERLVHHGASRYATVIPKAEQRALPEYRGLPVEQPKSVTEKPEKYDHVTDIGSSQPIKLNKEFQISHFVWDQTMDSVTVSFDAEEKLSELKDDFESHVTVEAKEDSVKMVIKDLNGDTHKLSLQQLYKQIDPHKYKSYLEDDKIVLDLRKKNRGEHWVKLIELDPQREGRFKENPNLALFESLKDMYDKGDDATKKTIAEGMEKAKIKQLNEPFK